MSIVEKDASGILFPFDGAVRMQREPSAGAPILNISSIDQLTLFLPGLGELNPKKRRSALRSRDRGQCRLNTCWRRARFSKGISRMWPGRTRRRISEQGKEKIGSGVRVNGPQRQVLPVEYSFGKAQGRPELPRQRISCQSHAAEDLRGSRLGFFGPNVDFRIRPVDNFLPC